MKTKSLYPIIATSDLGSTVDFYCNVLDYSVKHDFENSEGVHVMIFANTKGDEIEIIEAKSDAPDKLKDGLYGLRINVDSIDDAIEELEEKGCRIISGPVDSEFSRSLTIEDNNGAVIMLVEHVRLETVL